jgi:hypothetical protein
LVALVTPLCVTVAGSHADVAWQDEHCDVVLMWLALAGVKPLPVYAWQLVHDVTPVWFIFGLAEISQLVPMVWQLPQVLLVIGAAVCALAPLVGTPVAEVPLWQVVQFCPLVIPVWANEVGSQPVTVWQLEHCA